MPVGSIPPRLRSDSPSRSHERRKSRRFNMRLSVLLRPKDDSWAVGETVDVSASGTLFVTNRPVLVGAAIEYVLTFPPNLTNTPQPLQVRFFGEVFRCERVPEHSEAFAVAVRNKGHHSLKCLSSEQSASYLAIEQQLSATYSSAAAIPPRGEK